VPKIVSGGCELVNLCRINRSGPVFETQCTLPHVVKHSTAVMSIQSLDIAYSS